jgi:hypothetical protein
VAAAPAKQQRWTVLIRGIMLIPHYVVLYFLSIAASVVLFIGWWGALFTARLPEFAANFLSGYVRWNMRVQAYAMLLTDQYPPFSLSDEPGYPVRIAIPAPDRLNRAAVFFRYILMIPAALLIDLVTFGGLTIVALIAWLITLITGKLPTSLHLAYTAILRYVARYTCYSYLLTAAYPGGLFGDGPALPSGPVVPPADSGFEAADDLAAPGYGAPVYGTPGFQAPGAPADSQTTDWRLLLTRGAKQLLGWFIGIGAVLWVAYVVVIVIIVANKASVVNVNNAIDAMNTANSTLTTEMNSYQTTVQGCADAGCVEQADGQAATDFTNFANTLHSTAMPSSAVAAANALYADSTKLAQSFTQLSHLNPTISPAQYDSTATSLGLVAASNKWQQDDEALGTALNSAG